MLLTTMPSVLVSIIQRVLVAAMPTTVEGVGGPILRLRVRTEWTAVGCTPELPYFLGSWSPFLFVSFVWSSPVGRRDTAVTLLAVPVKADMVRDTESTHTIRLQKKSVVNILRRRARRRPSDFKCHSWAERNVLGIHSILDVAQKHFRVRTIIKSSIRRSRGARGSGLPVCTSRVQKD